MKRVLPVHRYDGELVDTCTPRPRMTRSDSSMHLFRKMSQINPVQMRSRHIRVECMLMNSRGSPRGDFRIKSPIAAELKLLSDQTRQYS